MTVDNSEHVVSDDDFILLFGRSQYALHAFIVGMVYRRADADDLLQEVNLALWKKRHTYDANADFLRWAIGFARIEVVNWRKKVAKSHLVHSDAVIDSLIADWNRDLPFYEERLEALAKCLEKLRKEEHRLVTEFYQQDISIDAISKMTNTPASTIYHVLNRAREALRRCVQLSL